MKVGRVIDGDEHDGRVRAKQLIAEANAEADRIRDAARVHAADVERTAQQAASEVVAEAHAAAARAIAQAEDEAARLIARVRHTDGLAADAPIVQASGDAVGRVEDIVGLLVRAVVPGVALGEVVRIDNPGFVERDGRSDVSQAMTTDAAGESRRASRGQREPVAAEVVGFHGEQALVLPLGELVGVTPSSAVWRTGGPLAIRCGDDLLGRAVDGLGTPIDSGEPLRGEWWPVERFAPPALGRPTITAPLATGVRAIDALLTLGRGQRIGLFAGAGVGKSTLLGQIARGSDADVIVVCQIGERGRELADLLGEELAPARSRTVVVCATSDAPPLVRVRAVHAATAIAEWFRDRRAANVLLLVDSLTRVARAQREVGLSTGEPPARHGYPPSVFALLPRLIERAGATASGAITAIYTVLVAGNDMDEPIADEVRGLVDGHIVLDRQLAQRGHFPPIDVVASVSRLMGRVVAPAHAEAASTVRARLATYQEHRDLLALGAYQRGRDRTVDEAMDAYPAIERVLRQRRDESESYDRAVDTLLQLKSTSSR